MSDTELKDNNSTRIIELELCRRDFYKLKSDPKLEHVMMIWPGTTGKFNPFVRGTHQGLWHTWHSEIDDKFFGWERGARFYESKACTHWIQPLKCKRSADIIRNFYPCAELAVETIASLKILNDFFPQQIKTASAVEKWLLALHQNMTPDANDLFDERDLRNIQSYDQKFLKDKNRWDGVKIFRFRDIRSASMSLIEVLLTTLESPLQNDEQLSNPKKKRDQWIYEQVCDVSKTLISIRIELKNLCEEKKWPNVIDTEMGISAAANRFAKKNKLPSPPSRKSD